MSKEMRNDNQKINFLDIFNSILEPLPERSREIVAKRFGVSEKKPMTLQAIGNDYTITRERVRQIVQSGLKALYDKNKKSEIDDVKEALISFMDVHHGIVTESVIIEEFGQNHFPTQGAVRYFIEGIKDLTYVNSKKYPVIDGVIVHADFDLNKWHAVHKTAHGTLRKKNYIHTIEQLFSAIQDIHGDIDQNMLAKFLVVSREIGKNPFNKWGLIEWDDISPRGVREKALLIMKEKKQPMHFREIAQAIDDHGLGKRGRKSHPQTVHNELIRDKNFVLVGRGVYTLNSQNYVGGTVKDVIEDLLKKSSTPLTSEEVIERVLKMRHVKPSTIKVNLNAIAKKLNKKYTLDSTGK